MKTITIASIATVILSSSLAFAHGGRGGLARFDRDGNGVVTRDEMHTTVLAKFDSADNNKDGRLTPDEMQAAKTARAQARFAKKDKNGDGRLSRDEVPRMPDAMWKKLDTNGDGALTPDELAAHRGGQHGKHAGKIDANQDGAISRDEAIAAADRRFARIDTNGDGVVTADEAKAAHHGHGKRGQQGPEQPKQ
jgi:Ca2+-binding EF-hand superfamily protein